MEAETQTISAIAQEICDRARSWTQMPYFRRSFWSCWISLFERLWWCKKTTVEWHRWVRTPLAPGTVQDGHPTVTLDPTHLRCSGCPGDGVGWECLDGEASLSQTAAREAPCACSQGPSHSCNNLGPVAANVALKLNLLRLFMLDSHLSTLPVPWWLLHLMSLLSSAMASWLLGNPHVPGATASLLCAVLLRVQRSCHGNGILSSFSLSLVRLTVPNTGLLSQDLTYCFYSVGWEKIETSVRYMLDKSWPSYWRVP